MRIFSFRVAMYWPERCRLRNTIVLERCCVSLRWIPRYTKIFHGNISPKYCLGTCVKTVLQNIKYERCGYFLIIGKLVIFHYFLRQEEFRNSQWFARYMGLNVHCLAKSVGTPLNIHALIVPLSTKHSVWSKDVN